MGMPKIGVIHINIAKPRTDTVVCFCAEHSIHGRCYRLNVPVVAEIGDVREVQICKDLDSLIFFLD